MFRWTKTVKTLYLAYDYNFSSVASFWNFFSLNHKLWWLCLSTSPISFFLHQCLWQKIMRNNRNNSLSAADNEVYSSPHLAFHAGTVWPRTCVLWWEAQYQSWRFFPPCCSLILSRPALLFGCPKHRCQAVQYVETVASFSCFYYNVGAKETFPGCLPEHSPASPEPSWQWLTPAEANLCWQIQFNFPSRLETITPKSRGTGASSPVKTWRAGRFCQQEELGLRLLARPPTASAVPKDEVFNHPSREQNWSNHV